MELEGPVLLFKSLSPTWRDASDAIPRQPLELSGTLNSRRLNMAPRKSSRSRKYGKAAGKSVKSAMHREKRGTLKSGRGGKGGTVKSRRQAIAIGLSEARKKGAKVPRKKAA
jgi:hypothetical protein